MLREQMRGWPDVGCVHMTQRDAGASRLREWEAVPCLWAVTEMLGLEIPFPSLPLVQRYESS